MFFPAWRSIAQVLLLATYMFISGDAVRGKYVKKKFISDIDSKLKVLNKPAVKTIQSSDGDIIDCVDIYKQSAFDHPALKNHIIQMTPSNYIPDPDTVHDQNKSSTTSSPLQTWRKNGSCPEGTIPIRRVRKEDLLRFNNLESFGRKYPPHVSDITSKGQSRSNRTSVANNDTVGLGRIPFRDHALLVATMDHYVGAKGNLNVWNPRVEADDASSSQIWLIGGGLHDYETIESGWTVYPQLYGDSQTRFFAFWTADAEATTGCFDLICPGFVQINKEIALGGSISPISSPGGTTYDIIVSIHLDNNTNNWWLRVNDKIDLGYWPSELFSDYLKSGATLAQWGGQVWSTNVQKTPHTSTQMGSGSYPEVLFKEASYVAHIKSMDDSYTWVYPKYISTYATEGECYAAYNYAPGWPNEPTFFFGGPGRSTICL